MADPYRVPFPRRIRLPAEAYADRTTLFHVTLPAHPEVRKFPDPVSDAIWEVVLEQRSGERVELFAACLMPDHLHLLIRPGGLDLLRFLNAFKSWTTRRSWAAGHGGALWQPGMWDRTIRAEGDDFAVTLRYIVENPVRAGLVDDVVDWPWTWVGGGDD